ncbi:ribosomal protein S5 domain 2-type protein [Polychytrium aggregatum]|uniref:ribosomal protein S5 domain 2-type protein n=1 Tax=Polychytrium aggregatum TaxID=110093 RepID=UPI0022FDD314|nr:ribosomal protein S5 domain 2-type protein [Polychytrium aggregatum]KAI9207780.1 ribosomal protein S5 domain 2-type protein [Polychytrium aggregatum]
MAPIKTIKIRVPASTANIGPGFDALGMGLSMHLTLVVTIPASSEPASGITLSYEGDSKQKVSLSPESNLITRTAMYVAAACKSALPRSMHIHIDNPIPLGRGLGSSGSAAVAGVYLANEAAQLGLSRTQMLDFCLLIEGHPDNVAGSLLGGFVASYMRNLPDPKLRENPLALSSFDQYDLIPVPPKTGYGVYMPLEISPKVKVVVAIPEFELPTKLAREVLPTAYSRADVIFNFQRLSVLTHALAAETPRAEVVYEAMHDKIHQHYRQHLVPGLPEILSMRPEQFPGLLGLAMSGAGPTVLAIAIDNFEAIGKEMKRIFASHIGPDGQPIQCRFEILDVDHDGATCETSVVA